MWSRHISSIGTEFRPFLTASHADQWAVVHFCTDTAKKPASSVSGCALLYRYSKETRLLNEWFCTSVQTQQRNPPPQWVVVHFCTDTAMKPASSMSGSALLYRYSKETRLLSEWLCTSVQIQQRNPPPQWVVLHFCTDTTVVLHSCTDTYSKE